MDCMKEKVLCMLSGGIDSPIATAVLAKKYEVVPLHFCLYPFYCKGSFETTIDILKKLKKKIKFKYVIFYPWSEILSTISRSKYRKFMCVLCRKSMFKVAEQVCKKEGIKMFGTGEALAQKASQTVSNMAATSYGIETEILRPLLALDKEEIVNLGKTMDVFMEVHAGCCNATPYKPATKSDPEFIEEISKELELDKIIESNLKKMKKVEDLNQGVKILSGLF